MVYNLPDWSSHIPREFRLQDSTKEGLEQQLKNLIAVHCTNPLIKEGVNAVLLTERGIFSHGGSLYADVSISYLIGNKTTPCQVFIKADKNGRVVGLHGKKQTTDVPPAESLLQKWVDV